MSDARLDDVEALFCLAPRLGLERPLAATLHVRFSERSLTQIEPGSADAKTLRLRLGTGSPFESIVFHADNASVADAIAGATGITPLVGGEIDERGLEDVEVALGAGNVSADLAAASVRARAFGRLAIVISALWGAVGSKRVFDAQLRLLVERGFHVVQLFVDHYPDDRGAASERVRKLLAEALSGVRGHIQLLAERDRSVETRTRLLADPDFRAASPLKRMIMLLAEAKAENPAALAWAAKRARLTLVNHTMHVGLAERVAGAPIVLETHDVFARLLDIHGIPDFVPPGPDGPELRAQEEAAAWERAAACVNISPDDQRAVATHARLSVVARPYAPVEPQPARPWPEIVAANALSERFRTAERFEIALWGSWHRGNLQAIEWFFADVVPVDARLQSARILVAGKVAAGLSPSILDRANVFAAAKVERMDELLGHATALVIPDRAGSGISMKTLEACALGRPFAATSTALRGLDLADGVYRGHDDPAELARDIVALLDDEAARKARVAAAAEIRARNYSPEAYAAAWDEVIAAVLGSGEAPTTEPERAPASAAAPPPAASVVICTYDRYPLLGQAIESVLAQRLPKPPEVIVVDNSLDQARAAAYRERYRDSAQVRYHLEGRPGLSNARNVGIGLARGPVVAFIDDDAIAGPDWLRAILHAFASFPEAGVVGGRVLPRWIAPRPPWLPEAMLSYLSVVDWGGSLRVRKPQEWFAGANIAFRREHILAVGGFARDLGRKGSDAVLVSNEEVDAVDRIEALGLGAVYAPDAVVEHLIDPQRLTHTWFRRRIAWQAVSDYLAYPAKTAAASGESAMRVLRYLENGSRSGPGFFSPTDRPDEFQAEAQIVYDLVTALLSGGVEVPEGTKRERRAGLLERLLGGRMSAPSGDRRRRS